MLREIAIGFTNRHHFVNSDQLSNWMNMPEDVFTSLFEYDEYIKKFFEQNKKLTSFDGTLYIPDEFILDVDGDTFETAHTKCHGLIELLNDLIVDHNIYFSGTGFHIGIPASAFRWSPSPNLNKAIKYVFLRMGIYEFADPAVSSQTQLIRLVNTKNTKSGLYKVYLTNNEFHEIRRDRELLKRIASSPRTITIPELNEHDAVFDLTIPTPRSTTVTEIRNNATDATLYPCIQHMLSNVAQGSRHMVALRLASWFRPRMPRQYVHNILHSWRSSLENRDGFSVKELDDIIESIYSGHNGQGSRYGCNDPIMDKFCKETCRLYRIKKNATFMEAAELDNVLVKFHENIKSGLIKPLKIFGTDFPIWPGEVVMIQAPPKSMKTLLLQNIVNDARLPTYFKEMEMNSNQIWSRFVQMHMNWTDDEFIENYTRYRDKILPNFSWLTMDFQSCYPFELQKKIELMNVKPMIVVIDHIRLLKSKQRDPNLRIEEASQALTELAINNNIIVFVVSEITKEAIREGMGVTSAKGSIGTVYNVNKLLSVDPYFSRRSGLIESLRLRTIVNREKEHLDIILNFNNYALKP